jgi:hypothetical protein
LRSGSRFSTIHDHHGNLGASNEEEIQQCPAVE